MSSRKIYMWLLKTNPQIEWAQHSFSTPRSGCFQQDLVFHWTAFSGSHRPVGSLHLPSLAHETCRRKDKSQPNQFKTRRNRMPLVSSCWQERKPALSPLCSGQNKSAAVGCQTAAGSVRLSSGRAVPKTGSCWQGCL